MKNVQLFTTSGGEYCEIDAQLISYHVKDGIIYLKTKDGDDIWEHTFPLWNVKMVRISKED